MAAQTVPGCLADASTQALGDRPSSVRSIFAFPDPLEGCTRMGSPREHTLETLHAAATDIQASESVEAACERTVEAAADILDFELCSIMLYEDGWLVPVALSSEAPPDGARRMKADQGLAGKTYQTGESYIVNDVESDAEADPAKPSYRSGLSVPLGDVGIFQAAETEPDAFDESDVELAELLVAHTARTIDRTRFQQELEASQQVLERQNERLEKFASVVTHDLRSPLNVAAGRLELAREECESEHLDAVEQAHDRMQSLIDDLLTLAREGGEMDDLEAVELDALVRECWATMETADAAFEVVTDRGFRADRSQLKQLLENLLRNAIDHGGSDVAITIGACDDGFYVADDGPGIPDDARDSLFEWGYSTSATGTGFGLAIVQDIATAHGWTVTVTDSETGGARFEFTGVEPA